MTTFLPKAPAVLAIHGSASSGRQWTSLRDCLRGKRTLVAPDVPGYGGVAAKDRRSYFMALLERMPGTIDLVAHSFGASIALYLANTVPQKIQSIVLYDPVVPIKPNALGLHLPSHLGALWHSVERGSPDSAMRAFIEYWVGPNQWERLNDDRRSTLLAQFTTVRRDFIEASSGYWTPSDVSYSGPLQVLCGGRSPGAIDQITDFLRESYVQAKVEVVDDLDHMAPLTQRDRTDALISAFLCEEPSEPRLVA